MKSLKVLLMVAITFLSLSAFAQDSTKQKTKAPKSKTENVSYTCPMHPEVLSDKPGKCSKCGMNLVKKEKEEMVMYSCPMHPEVTSDKPGKCSKCGMNLAKIETIAKAYSCPMHPEVTSNMPGKCPKCGMALKKNNEEDHSDHQN
ncbi:MAG: hypothetical protein JJE22_02030 [Bacteroidia bacterium]|nr:hypothetical protein [Bacteroidia bacterium]